MTPSSGEDRLIANAGAETSDENAIMADRPVIQCDAVTKFYGTTRAVAEVNISLAAGEILALVGPSGGGKTTFLRLIAGFESPDSGTVTLDGRTVAGPGYWVPPEDRKLGMVFQDYALFPHMTVYRNVLFALGGWSKPAPVQESEGSARDGWTVPSGGKIPTSTFGRRATKGCDGPFSSSKARRPAVG